MRTHYDNQHHISGTSQTLDSFLDEAWRPFCQNNLSLDIDETDSAYRVQASMPGIAPENIHVSLRDNVLTIIGKSTRSKESRDPSRRIIMRERQVGRFSRSVRLQASVNAEAVRVNYENGVLLLHLPKGDASTQPHRIAVSN